MVENQFDTNVKSIRTDNRLKFLNTKTSSFLKSKEYSMKKTYMSAIKWCSRKKHYYLLKTVNAILLKFKLPLKYWGDVFYVPHTSSIDSHFSHQGKISI